MQRCGLSGTAGRPDGSSAHPCYGRAEQPPSPGRRPGFRVRNGADYRRPDTRIRLLSWYLNMARAARRRGPRGHAHEGVSMRRPIGLTRIRPWRPHRHLPARTAPTPESPLLPASCSIHWRVGPRVGCDAGRQPAPAESGPPQPTRFHAAERARSLRPSRRRAAPGRACGG